MRKDRFVDNVHTKAFSLFLSNIINGTTPLDFQHNTNTYHSLEDAKKSYIWPPKKKTIDTPNGSIVLLGGSRLKENEKILVNLSDGLNNCLNSEQPNEEELFGWVSAIMVWGGVYTKTKNGKGNNGWLESKKGTLGAYMRATLDVLRSGSDDEAHKKLLDFRSNAGTTKVHSLALSDFVIYDSRVAASLAWLVKKWASDSRISPPEHLRFACMKANTSKWNSKSRSPDTDIFPYFVASGDIKHHHAHATWNIRANWIIREALDLAINHNSNKQTAAFQTLRDVEASLFMVGDDLNCELAKSVNCSTVNNS
jgi:hypothetical protein